jgi:hypothetical protein
MSRNASILQRRLQLLDVAYQLHLERFARHAPKSTAVPTEVWINKALNLEIKLNKLRDHVSHSC